MVHPLVTVVDSLETALDEAGLSGGIGASALSAAELRDVARRAWVVVRRVQGAVVVPVVAEAAERRLYRHEPYVSASSTRDLITDWLRCDPKVAGQLLEMANRTVRGGFRATGQALAAGEIDLDHARAVVRSVRSLPAGVMSETDYRRTESTMLDTAKRTDPGVTAAAGARLLEVIAPEAAQEHLDRKAERDRQRAEESRWFEVTGIGIAGCKELRLRAESDVIDELMRVITSLTQPSTVDHDGGERTAEAWGANDPDAADHQKGSDAARHADPAADGGAAEHVYPAEHSDIQEHSDTADNTVSAVDTERAMPQLQPAGLVAEGSLHPTPVERRRADAAVEVIDAIARPDLLDELTPAQLRRLADKLEDRPDHRDVGEAENVTNIDTEDTRTRKVDADGPAVADHVDAAFTAMIDTSLVTTDTCTTMVDVNQTTPAAVRTAGTVPTQRLGRVTDPEAVDSVVAVDTAGMTGAVPVADTGGPTATDRTSKALVPANSPRRAESSRATTAGRGPGADSAGAGRVGAERVAGGRTSDRGSRVRGERPALVVLVPHDNRGNNSPTDRDRDAAAPFYRPRSGDLRSAQVSSPGAPSRLASATEVERLACEATMTPVWMADGVEPVAVAAPSRFFRGKQLTALIARDRGCAFPGCSRGLRYAHAHHIVPWSQGGPTTAKNGVLLCSHHHRVVHRTSSWLVRMGIDGLPEFLPPHWIDPERRPQRHVRHQSRLPLAS